MSIREAQQRIDAAEFAEWQAYFSLAPWGEDRADWRAGMLASTMANLWATRKGTKRFTPQDFMPRFGRDRPRNVVQTPEQLKTFFRTITLATGGTIHGRDRQPHRLHERQDGSV